MFTQLTVSSPSDRIAATGSGQRSSTSSAQRLRSRQEYSDTSSSKRASKYFSAVAVKRQDRRSCESVWGKMLEYDIFADREREPMLVGLGEGVAFTVPVELVTLTVGIFL